MLNRIVLSGSALFLLLSCLLLPVGAKASFAAEKGPLLQSELIQMAADQQTYDGAKAKTYLKGHVSVAYKNVRIKSVEGVIDLNAAGSPELASFFKRPTAKRLEPKVGEDDLVADIIRIHLNDDAMTAEGNVVSYVTTVASDPFTIRSDVQQFDNLSKTILARGQVSVNYKGTKIFSPRAILQVGPSGKAEKAVFSGGARMEEEASEVTGEKLTMMIASGNLIADNNVKSRVKVKDAQGNQTALLIIHSDYQQYDKASDTVIASGNVKIDYDGYIATGPKATFKMKNGQIDNILLVGRPSIIENDRKIVADKITITTLPKHFDAYGNVKTQFQKKPMPAASTPTSTPAASAKGGKKPVTATNPRKPAPKIFTPEQDLVEE